jgi:uncharacterized protein YjbJ (UPF0337 family)
MNTDIIKGNWKEVKGKIKQQWGKLTDDEITQMKGTYDELEGHLQKKYGYQKDQAKTEIEKFLGEHGFNEKA